MSRTSIDPSLLATVPSSKISGTATNDNAAAGKIGEYISATTGFVNFPASDSYDDLTSISLTAGDWDVSASMYQAGIFAPNITEFRMGVSLTSGNSFPEEGPGFSNACTSPAITGTSASASIHTVRFSLSTTTTIYFKRRATYTSGTPTSGGKMWARRVR